MCWLFGSTTRVQLKAIAAKQDKTLRLLQQLANRMETVHMPNLIDRLEKAVEAQTDVHDAVEQLINNFVDEIKSAGGDKKKLESILHSITANTDRLADLVLEHTEAEDEEDKEEIPPQVLEPGEAPEHG